MPLKMRVVSKNLGLLILLLRLESDLEIDKDRADMDSFKININMAKLCFIHCPLKLKVARLHLFARGGR